MATHLLIGNSPSFDQARRREGFDDAFRCWPLLKRLMADLEERMPNCAERGLARDKELQEAML